MSNPFCSSKKIHSSKFEAKVSKRKKIIQLLNAILYIYIYMYIYTYIQYLSILEAGHYKKCNINFIILLLNLIILKSRSEIIKQE